MNLFPREHKTEKEDLNIVCFCFSEIKANLDCIEKAVKKNCGSEAAEHQMTIEKLFLKETAKEIDCDLCECLWIQDDFSPVSYLLCVSVTGG